MSESRTSRVPDFSGRHPIIPRDYKPGFRVDIPNRRLIMKNCESSNGRVPNYEHDDKLFLENREQVKYNVESHARVTSQYPMPQRGTATYDHPFFDQTGSKHQSSLMSRFS